MKLSEPTKVHPHFTGRIAVSLRRDSQSQTDTLQAEGDVTEQVAS